MKGIKIVAVGTVVIGAAVAIMWMWNRNAAMDFSRHGTATADNPAHRTPPSSTGGGATITSLGMAPVQIQHMITNAGWDAVTITACWSQIGPIDPYDLRAVVRLTTVAQAASLPPPRNGEELLKCVYSLPLTNKGDSIVCFILLNGTNEAYADLLFLGYTNCHFQAMEIADMKSITRDIMMCKSSCSLRALRHIGTPAVIDRLNKLHRQLQKEGRKIFEPGEVIDPAKYPVEARDWLLNYPEPDVRYNMLREWIISGRPETPEVLDEFCKRVRDMPDDFYLWKRGNAAAGRKQMIKEVQNSRDEYVRRYKRWVDDGKKENFNSGSYSDPD